MFNADQIQYANHTNLARAYKSGANWFYWIAGLSMLTSIIGFAGGGWRFFVSLGTTQVIDGFAEGLSIELGDATRIVALVLDLLVTGAFASFGWLAGKKYLWAYVVGMAVFLLDGLVALMFSDWISVGVHVLVLYLMFRGLQAGRNLVALEQEMAQQTPEPSSQAENPAPASV